MKLGGQNVHWMVYGCCMAWSTLTVGTASQIVLLAQPPVLPSPPLKSAKKGVSTLSDAKKLNTPPLILSPPLPLAKDGKKSKAKGSGPPKVSKTSIQIGTDIFTHVGTATNGVEICMKKKATKGGGDTHQKKRKMLLNLDKNNSSQSTTKSSTSTTSQLHQRMLQYAPSPVGPTPTTTTTFVTATTSPQYPPTPLVVVDVPPPPPPKESMFVPITGLTNTNTATDSGTSTTPAISPSAPTTPVTYPTVPTFAPSPKKSQPKKVDPTITTMNDVAPPAVPTTKSTILKPYYSKSSIGTLSNVTTSPYYNASINFTAPTTVPPVTVKTVGKVTTTDPLNITSAGTLFVHPGVLPTNESIDVLYSNTSITTNVTGSSTNTTFVIVLDPVVFDDVTFSACPADFSLQSESDLSLNIDAAAGSICDVGFAGASDSLDEKNFTVQHSYELLIKTGLTTPDKQLIISSIETLMGSFVVADVFNCSSKSRRFLYGGKPNITITSANFTDSSALISKYSLSPPDTVSSTTKCTQLHAEGNNTTCIVVNSSSTVFYTTNLSNATILSIEEHIHQVVANQCTIGNLSSTGGAKCAALPSIYASQSNTNPTAKTVTAGRVNSNPKTEPTPPNSAQTMTQNQKASKSLLSTTGVILVVLSAMGILTLLSLFALQKRRKIKESSRFCELEETEIADDVIVGKYGLDVEDKSVFTNVSKKNSNQLALTDEGSQSLDGEQILDDLKSTEDNPVLFKRGGSYQPRVITEENGNIDVEEPFFLGRYETYTPTIRKTRMDDSVTL